ncbi:ATP-dependent helicase HrpB [Pelagerythrobacter rhizovicinus]|uniref:ATP-dependent helicase HrpB n=1 Tax=Pelagerythrobacter rhizovicinus TaxID=2268576 RepID=A0A4Q2KN71_9SPHN|nr:ATP-dependent helicase HrpB [Pelagerythrobacter rhizovicinus]RXZ65740.1 ATP-dependent helicase HrpB [Pelagerythrobacter rhizovicinus]
MNPTLPIHAVLPDLLAALRTSGAAVLVAPPGAGKTTAVAPALLNEGWCTGQVILLSPRRVAARAAAERMAEMLGEKAGETVGYLSRLDSRTSARTRVLVMTEAIFVNRVVEDPELAGVSAVLFDEAHERHLDSDLGLALALESRAVLREDLRICVMSATIDGARFARLLGDEAPVIESEGRAFPLEIRWLGSSPDKRIEDAMAQAVLTAWRETEGDVLAFLPGVREIERTDERLAERLREVPILPLHGQVEPAGQRAAIRRDPQGRRRIVLATAIAETSLTLDGVSVVVDSGLARHAEFDRAAGTTHLVTRRASQASAGQRAGRAARQGPGVAYRLWEQAAHLGRPEFDLPEIAAADLAPLALNLARWGTHDPASLAWLDPPPAASIASARERLMRLGALDGEGRITLRGEMLAALPLDPAHAAMVLFGAEQGAAREAAKIALLLQERGLGGRGEDLAARLQRWNADRAPRAEASRKLAARWAERAEHQLAAPSRPYFPSSVRPEPVEGPSLSSGAALKKKSGPSTSSGRTGGRLGPRDKALRAEEGKQADVDVPPAILLAAGLPDNVARRRDPSGEHWLSAGGRGFVLDPASPLARTEWLAIGDAQGQAKGARITAALALEEADLERWLPERIERRSVLRWNEREGRVEARLERRLGAIVLASGPDPAPDPAEVVDILVEKAVERLATLLPPELIARPRYAGIEALLPEALAETADLWLRPLLEGRRDLAVPRGKLVDALLGQLDWDSRQRLDRAAPREFVSPAGTRHPIDYTGDDAPSVEVRVQALFGLERHPMVGDTPLLLKLTSPAGRPIQATRDLPGFWRGSWADVRKDMKGRYPKHRWPEEPWTEAPSLKTKNAFSNGGA